MSSRKRGSDDTSRNPRKKAKTLSKAEDKAQAISLSQREEVDFPRGGGTSFTPIEYKAIREEALKELKDGEVFKVLYSILSCPHPVHGALGQQLSQ